MNKDQPQQSRRVPSPASRGSAVFKAVYALRRAKSVERKIAALREVFIREPMLITVTTEADELAALEFYITEMMLLPNDQTQAPT